MRETSLTAYFNEICPTLGARQIKVLEAFERGESLTNSEIAERLQWSINRVTPRVLELRKMCLVEDGGLRTCRITGRTVNTWRAKTSAPRLEPTFNKNIFQFQSKSRIGETYKVSELNGNIICTCPGFKFRGKCSHIQKVEKQIIINNSMATLF